MLDPASFLSMHCLQRRRVSGTTSGVTDENTRTGGGGEDYAGRVEAHDETMAVLMGLMVGSLGMLWPYQGEGGTLLSPADGNSLTPLLAMAIGSALIGLFLFLDGKKTGDAPVTAP